MLPYSNWNFHCLFSFLQNHEKDFLIPNLQPRYYNHWFTLGGRLFCHTFKINFIGEKKTRILSGFVSFTLQFSTFLTKLFAWIQEVYAKHFGICWCTPNISLLRKSTRGMIENRWVELKTEEDLKPKMHLWKCFNLLYENQEFI